MSDQPAFSGLRILDFTQVLAGPFATQQLAQLGADVIKIEQPGVGDITRGLMAADSNGLAPSFLTCNIGKRSLALDLKQESARELVFKLIATSDAVVENFKPGTIERLGFGYDAVRSLKPDIVYASISGYGQSGPKAELPAFDGAIQASSGMMSVSGFPESGPVRAGYFAVDMSTALNAAFAISAALYRRLATGEGQRVDVAMQDTALAMLAPQMSAYGVNETLPELIGNRSPTKQPTANVFKTQDGFVQIVALKERQIQTLFATLGLNSLYDGNENPRTRIANFEPISAEIGAVLETHPTDHWLNVLGEAGVPASPIRNLAEVAADPQLESRLILTETKDGNGDLKKVVSASHVTYPGPPTVQRHAPTLGEHSREVLAELGLPDDEIDSLFAAGVVA